jgi:hypothetical protein
MYIPFYNKSYIDYNYLKHMGKVIKNIRQVRWNWEKSPDNEEMARYHFVIIDDKNRKEKITRIMDSIRAKIDPSYSFDLVRSVEGKMEGIDFRYLFESYDTLYSPNLLNMDVLFKKNFRDKDLYERSKGNIEDYVSDLHG